MERTYEKYSENISKVIAAYKEMLSEAATEATKKNCDPRLSEIGRAEEMKAIAAELDEKANSYTAMIHRQINAFCSEYDVTMPEDGQNHDTDISNALKVIDMLGFKMTPNALRAILDPIKGSFNNTKMIYDIMTAKDSGGPEGYSYEVRRLLDEYAGSNPRIVDYIELFNKIKGAAENKRALSFTVTRYTEGRRTVEIDPKIPYSIAECPSLMIKAGKEYAILEDLAPAYFKKHIPSSAEIITSNITHSSL